MKKLSISLSLVLFTSFSFAQDFDWTFNNGHIYNANLSGNVGIGISNPESPLDIEGRLTIRRPGSSPHGTISSTHGLLRFASNTSDYIISLQDGSGRVQHYWNSTTGTSPTYLVSNEDAGKISFNPASTGVFEIYHAPDGTSGQAISWDSKLEVGVNYVGIMTSSPTETLDVNGTGRFRDLTQDNTQTRILVSDSNGKLFWRQETSLPDSDSQTLTLASNSLSIINGNSVDLSGYLDNTDNQTLSLNGTLLSISNGNSVDLNGLLGGSSGLIHNSGSQNIFVGEYSGNSIASGFNNTATGVYSLYSNTSGTHNTAIGTGSLFYNTTGKYNVATGNSALQANTSGERNVAIGVSSLASNSTGSNNTAAGDNTLNNNTVGNFNTANGSGSLKLNTSGSYNTAIGTNALALTETGYYNVAVGFNALYYNDEGGNMTAIGAYAGPSIFYQDLINSTALGHGAVLTSSNQVRIGNSSVTDIGGQVSWSTLSDGRFKRDLKEDVEGLSFINSLKPVSYQVDKDKLNTHLGIPDSIQQEMKQLNAKSTRSKNSSGREIGFVAQDVVAAMKETGFEFNGVHIPENEHDHYTIRYGEFVVPLVKAVQELSEMVEKQQDQIDILQSALNNSENEEFVNGKTNSSEVKLFQNAPNPFDQSTAIKMELPDNVRQANLMIYNLEGKQIESQTISNRGQVEVQIAGSTLEAGMYIYALIVDGKVIDQKRMILTE